MELDYQAIGIRIRRLRKEQGLTQQRLAELSSQEPSNISHIERGATKLLCDSLEFSKAAFEREISEILSDCTHQELRIISGTMRVLKDNLRKVGI